MSDVKKNNFRAAAPRNSKNNIKLYKTSNRATDKLLRMYWFHRSLGPSQSMLVYGISDISEAYLSLKQRMI